MVDVFLGTRSARAQTSKSVPRKCPSLPVRPATLGSLPIKVKVPYASPVSPSETYYWQTQHKSAFQQVDLPLCVLADLSDIISQYHDTIDDDAEQSPNDVKE